ncbi:hypothetical protein Lfu02_76370 [Longispora fulva]|nr:hypothetical protein Lfu02_76370 [Longispora fulva]
MRQKESQIARSAAIAAQIGVARFDVTKKLFNMTELVAEVGRVVFPSDPVSRHGLEVLWTYQSAHAHGTLYARQRQVAGLPARTPQGVLLGRARASIGDLVTPAAAAALLVNEAWRRYGELSTT